MLYATRIVQLRSKVGCLEEGTLSFQEEVQTSNLRKKYGLKIIKVWKIIYIMYMKNENLVVVVAVKASY